MSRRAVKRYEQQKLDASKYSDEENGNGNELTSPSTPNNKASLFSLLALDDVDDDASPDEKEDREEENEEEVNNSSHPQPNDSNLNEPADENVSPVDIDVDSQMDNQIEDLQPKTQQPTQSSKKKKKKKRKGGKRTGPANRSGDVENDPDWIALNEFEKENKAAASATASENDPIGFIPRSFFSPDDGDDVRDEAKRIMALIEQIAFPEREQAPISSALTSSTANKATAIKALHVEPLLLNADFELKRMFGSRVVQSERRGEEAAAAASRRKRGIRTSVTRRKVSLVSPRDTWFDHAPGLIMELDAPDNGDGVKYFRYAHEGSYSRLQDEYRMVVRSHDPRKISALASRHPYHVDSLLQLAELHRQMGELDRAAEFIERSLYVMEASWHLTFKPFDGMCRLRFDLVENRSLYIALFRYSQLLARRGLHRTALEISKLILNFDPENDPMGTLLLADSYALLAGEYDWVLHIRDSYVHIPIKYFPNFSASAALSIDMAEQQTGSRSNSLLMGTGKRLGTRDDAENQGKEGQDKDAEAESNAKEALIDALLTYPMLLKPLLDGIGDSSGVWTESRLYDEAWYSVGYTDGGVLARISWVYAERSKLLWNSGRAKELLVSCARIAGRLDDKAGMGKDPQTGTLTSAFVRDEKIHARVAKCRALRIEAANWLAQCGLYRKVQIADFTDSITNLPAEILAGDAADRAIGAQPPRVVSIGRSALEFLQSFLPWRDAQDASAENAED